jgi:cell division protein FtsB
VNSVARQRVRFRRFIDGLILMVILASAAICFSVYTRARSELVAAVIKHEEMTGKVWELGAQVEKLERSVNQLKTDARVIESFARQKFGFVKSGDVVIKLPEEQEAASRDVEARRRQLQSRAVVTKKGPNSVNL